MGFLVHAQLPSALARWLAFKAYNAEHVNDAGMQAASDTAIWGYALASDAAINTPRRDLLAWFETILPDVLAALKRGETLIKVA